MLIIKNVIGEAFDNDSIEGIRTELKQRISLVRKGLILLICSKYLPNENKLC